MVDDDVFDELFIDIVVVVMLVFLLDDLDGNEGGEKIEVSE